MPRPRPKGEKHWVLGPTDQPYTNAHAFTDRVSEWCTDIGLPKCTPHGLRKAAAAFCAEAGMSHADLMAIFGWETMSPPDIYIRQFQRQRAAMRAMPQFTVPRRRSNPTKVECLSHL
jgi:integrase